jgi:hypothetical protein
LEKNHSFKNFFLKSIESGTELSNSSTVRKMFKKAVKPEERYGWFDPSKKATRIMYIRKAKATNFSLAFLPMDRGSLHYISDIIISG